uniref:Signal recognition particle receptor subunit beta n=1 Tax=Ditylenchus dipsaci TaxID=166011 RepID=A0A915E254_9BILA
MTQENIFAMVNSASDYVIPAIATFLLLLLSSVMFFVWRKFGTKGDAILLVGLNGSGKTRIFTKLINSKIEWSTYTSMMENLYLGFSDANLRLVDYPGAESLRKGLCDKWLNKDRKNIRGIIFVVDSSNYVKKSKDVAEFLYEVLFESNKSLPVLVACNKQDAEEPHQARKFESRWRRNLV